MILNASEEGVLQKLQFWTTMVNSCIFLWSLFIPASFHYTHSAMIIGFTQRMQAVSEGDAPLGADSFPLVIGVHSLRFSEILYEVQFRVLENSNASVEAVNQQFSENFDALFGSTDSEQDPIVDSHRIDIGSLVLESPLTASIINDFDAEDLIKCFTLRIVSPDVVGDRNIFSCNQEPNAVDFFCLHTICIHDDDGQFSIYSKIIMCFCLHTICFFVLCS